jgi:hypothetical protein
MADEYASILRREELLFPSFSYHIDESDSDIVNLHRQDGSLVAVFSASGATREGIVEAAKEDYRELIRANPTSLARESDEHRSA